MSLSDVLVLSDEALVHVSHAEFPAPLQQFKTSPEVEMMYLRYKLYREGRESLLGMAYWCLTVIEYSQPRKEVGPIGLCQRTNGITRMNLVHSTTSAIDAEATYGSHLLLEAERTWNR